MEPRRTVLAPALQRWLDGGGDGDGRTVVVRLPPTADPQRAVEALEAGGALVCTVGAASITCVVGPDALRALAQHSWVHAVEEPRRLFPGPATPW